MWGQSVFGSFGLLNVLRWSFRRVVRQGPLVAIATTSTLLQLCGTDFHNFEKRTRRAPLVRKSLQRVTSKVKTKHETPSVSGLYVVAHTSPRRNLPKALPKVKTKPETRSVSDLLPFGSMLSEDFLNFSGRFFWHFSGKNCKN